MPSTCRSSAAAPLKPRERSTLELLRADPEEPYYRKYEGRFRAELHDRFLNPLYGVVFGLIAFAALGQARTTRQGRGLAILGAIVAVLAVRVAGVGISALSQKQASAVWMSYALPGAAMLLAWLYAFAPRLLRFPRRLPLQPARAA